MSQKRGRIIGLFATMFTLVVGLFAQRQGDGGMPYFPLAQSLIPTVHFPQPNVKQLRSEDKHNDSKGVAPWRFGWNNDCQLTLNNSGIWVALDNGAKIWTLKVICDQAQTVNLTFSNVNIPEGNHLFVYDGNYASTLGKFTQKHVYQGYLGTDLVVGNTAVIEYYVAPENNYNIGTLTLSTLTHGYRLWDEFQQKAFGSAAWCNKNVNCDEAVAYEHQKKSVVMIVSGGNGICSGTLINNTAYDGTPYVLTANHCYSSAIPSWVFRFNWESADCNNPSDSPDFSSLSGGQLVARRVKSDFLLIKIMGGLESGKIPASCNVYFSGWDRTGNVPQTVVSMHHPRGDIKKISFSDRSPEIVQSMISNILSDPSGAWKVIWDRNTTTESASSGGGLFNEKQRLIGQLWGGQASCANSGTGADFFGRIYTSWNPVGSDSSDQLEHWLDPLHTNARVIDGYNNQNVVNTKVSLIEFHQPKGVVCGTDFTPSFRFINLGTEVVQSLTFAYGYNHAYDHTYQWVGNCPFLASENIDLPAENNFPVGEHSLSVKITHINGNVVTDELSDSLSTNFFVMNNPQTITLKLGLDKYPDETSWQLLTDNDIVIGQNPPYSEDDAETTQIYTFCLSEGCYKFIIADSYKDGMHTPPGFFQIYDEKDSLLTEMTAEESDFGESLERAFCLAQQTSPPPPPPPLPDPPDSTETPDPPTSSHDLKNHLVEVYPNPNMGMIYWTHDEISEVSLFDLQGNKLLHQTLTNGTKHWEIPNISHGVYWLNMQVNNGQTVRHKIVLMPK